MPDKPVILPMDFDHSIAKLVAAHGAIREEIATHAEKHRAKVNEMRAQRKRDLDIAAGVKRNVSSV